MQQTLEKTHNYENIPEEMKSHEQWVLYTLKWDENQQKFTKIPRTIKGDYASSTDPKTWTSYSTAIKVFESTGDFDGLGFVFTENDPFVVVDFDDCIIDGEISENRTSIVNSFDSYTEVSQSGEGLHIVAKGDDIGQGFNNHHEGIEMYSNKRFVAMTGNLLEGATRLVNDAYMMIPYLDDTYRPSTTPKNDTPVEDQPEMYSDDHILMKARNSKNSEKFIALYDNGDIHTWHSGDDSAADQGLANILAWWTKNIDQIERLMRKSALYREKWDRKESTPYLRGRTIPGALQTVKGGYGDQDNFHLNVNEANELIPKPFLIKYGNLYKTVEKGSGQNKEEIDVFISRHIPFLSKEYHNVEHPQVFYSIEWDERGKTVSDIFPASSIAIKKDLLELSGKGLSVNDVNARELITFFDRYLQINELERHMAVERMGRVKNEFIHPVLSENVKIVVPDQGENQLLEAFEVKGTTESWKREVFERIKDQPKALFVMLSSFASTIIKDLGVDPFLVDMSGATSQGKTTTLKASASPWGSKHLVNEWNVTAVAMERKAAFLNSYPLLMDDTRKAKNDYVLQNIIYQFSGGRSKGRGSVTGSQTEKTWGNILISTGENPLIEYAKSKGGAAARVIPINDSPLEYDPDNVNELLDAAQENYGAAGIDFLKAWESHKGELVEDYHKVKKIYQQKAKGQNVLSRLAEYYAAVHFTGQVLMDYLGLDVNLQNLVRLFDEIAEENKDVDKPMMFLEQILIDLDGKRDYILDGYENTMSPLKSIWKNDQLYLLPAYTKEFLGVEESQTRNEWQKRGITISKEQKGKRVDYTRLRVGTAQYRAIPVNMEYVNELGFDFSNG